MRSWLEINARVSHFATLLLAVSAFYTPKLGLETIIFFMFSINPRQKKGPSWS
jgi:hypothetical protein